MASRNRSKKDFSTGSLDPLRVAFWGLTDSDVRTTVHAWFKEERLGDRLSVERQGEECARAISGWRKANSMWQWRASVVAFVNLSGKGDGNLPGFTDMVLDNCSYLLGSQERFAQTGVGWVLRELSRSSVGRVVGLVEANLNRFSREALQNATKYLPLALAERLQRAHLPSGASGRRRR